MQMTEQVSVTEYIFLEEDGIKQTGFDSGIDEENIENSTLRVMLQKNRRSILDDLQHDCPRRRYLLMRTFGP